MSAGWDEEAANLIGARPGGQSKSGLEMSQGPLTRQAMILAGGLGTRLRAAVADRPKPMADVAGRPFIAFLLDQLLRHGFQRAILCVGYLGEYVPAVLGDKYGALDLEYSFEPTAL